MTSISWISVCAFVMAAAISVSERDDIQENVTANDAFTGEENMVSSGELWSTADPTERSPSPNDGRHEDDNALNKKAKTDNQEQILRSNVLAYVSRLGDAAPDFHSNMRKIYRNYRQGLNDSSNPGVISAVQNYLGKNIPSLQLRNESTKTNKRLSINTKTAMAGLTKNVSKDQEKEVAAQDALHNRKQKVIHQKNETKEAKVGSETTVTDSVTEQTPQPAEDIEYESLETVLSCQHVTGFQEPRWLRMIAMCPTHWADPTTGSQCESWDSLNTLNFVDDVTFLPVQDENGTVYANVYCALCHNVGLFLPWTTSFACDNKDPPQTLQMSLFTDITALHSYMLVSKCQRIIRPAIPEALQKCTKGPLQTRRRLNSFAESITSTYPVSFSVLMNFDFIGQTHILFSASQTIIHEEYISRCQESETYDPYYQSCRQITCSRSYTLIAGICVRTGEDPSYGDSITDLSQLRTVNVVSLLLNISFGDFLVIKFSDTEPDIVPQIAEQLNISVDRIKDVNITFELGSINGSALQVTTLTEDEYKKLFPPPPPANMTQRWPGHGEESGKSENSFRMSISSEPPEAKENDTDTTPDYASQNSDSGYSSEPGMRSTTQTYNSKAARQQKKIKFGHRNETKPHRFSSGHALSEEERAGKLLIANSFELFDQIRSNSSLHNMFISKKLWKQALKFRGKLASTEYQNFFRYYLKSPHDGAEFYISAPINDQNERIALLIRNSLSIGLLLQQSMVMRISFALVPPDDPDSDEIGTNKLLQMIDKLIFEQQFSLTVNGNSVDVVAMDDNREDVAEEKQFCPWGIEYMVYDGEFIIEKENNVTLMYVNKTNSYVEVGKFDLYVLLSGNNNADQTNFTNMMSYAFVCFMPRIIQKECKQIRLSKDEYYVAGDNKSIVFEEKIYDIFSYRVLDETTGEIKICMPPSFNNDKGTLLPQFVIIESGCSSDFNGALRAEGYMTLVLGRVSCFALSCVILTYLLFSKMRNLPGLNMMNLTFCLLVTQVIFAEGIGEKRPWLCSGVAISLHYTLLAAHFWMNIMSYDVYKTFTSPVITHIREKKKYFPRYALYAWGIPFIVVSFCVFIDFSHLFAGVSIGYGNVDSPSTDLNFSNYNYTNEEGDPINSSYTSATDEHQIHPCWITQPLAALIAFGSIILTFFLVNCIFFGKTIMSISRTAKIAKKSLTTRHSNSSFQKVADNSEVMLYVKMSSVMGFTWIFGLSSSILSSFVRPATYTACTTVHVLAILFIILNSSQGIFIFVAFVCNRRVFALYKDFIHNIKIYLAMKRRGSLFSISSTVSLSRNAPSNKL